MIKSKQICTILNIVSGKDKLLRFICIALLLAIATPMWANYQYHYTRISTNMGLSNSSINSIYRDHNNTLWVGTIQGLNHLNGYEVNSYYTTSGRSSIPNNNIIFITGSSRDEVVVSTQSGVVRYIASSDSFEPITCQGDQITADIYCRVDDDLYMVSSRGIYLYNNNGTCSLYFDLRGRNKLHSRFNSIIASDVQGIFLVGTRHDGLWQIDTNSGVMQRVEWYPYDSVIAISKSEDADNFWVTPYNTGIFNFSMSGELLTSFDAQNSELKDNLTLAISVIGQKLFVGSNGNGIYIIDIPSKRLNSVRYNTFYEPAIETAKCFSNSSNPDQLWAGSLDDGVFDLSSVSIRAYGKATDFSNESFGRLGLSAGTVNCLLKDGDKVWIGTDGGGVNRLNIQDRTFRHYPATESLKVVSIVKWSKHELLISAYSRGLFIFDTLNNTLRPVLEKEFKKYMSAATPVNLLVKGDNLYMFSNKGAVYNRRSGETSALPLVELPYPSPMTPVHTTDSTAYIISKRALYELNFRTNRIEPLCTPEIEGSFISSAAIDQNDVLWLGHDNGVMCYDLRSEELTHEQALDQLRVNAIAVSSSGKYWIGAENTLYRYDRQKNHIQSYNSQIGFSPNAFKGKAALHLDNGNLLMAGASGLIVIPNNIKQIVSQPLHLTIDRILINGEVVDPKVWKSDEDSSFKIPNSNVVQLALKHDNENLFYQYKFRYYINDEMFVESDDNLLNLGSLNGGGSYDLSVSYLDIDDNWSERQQLMTFKVPVAWYLQWYSILLFSSIVAAAVMWQVHRYRVAEVNQYHSQLNDHLKRISQEKIEFLTNINHELRTPLTLMRAPLLQVAKNLPDGSEESKLSKLALKQVMRMKYIVDMVLDINKIDSGNKILYKTAVNVDEWLSDFVENFDYESQQHNIRIVVSHSDELKQTMLDRGKLDLVIANLISNAIKFSPENSTITIHSSISERERIRICVKDQGIGIKVDPKLLFDAFYQENVNGVGTGLGLSYARSIVELHDGEIGCNNNADGVGANFYFEIPIVECSKEDLAVASPRSSVSENIIEADLSHYVAVIVEDDQSVREYLSAELRKRFKAVHIATNGIEGLQQIRKIKPHIVISDVMMPVMNGFELCQTLKNESDISHIPVILLTAYVGQDNKLAGYKVGADNYITKPFDMEYLVAVVGNTLNYRHQVRSRSKSSNGIIDSKEATFSPYDERFMVKINTIVERELSNPELNVDMIASAVAMSRTSLYNKMKSVADVSVRDYIIRIRMERARELLSNRDLPIADIAAQVGFTDQRYFSTTFKQYHKQTPSEYRNSNA